MQITKNRHIKITAIITGATGMVGEGVLRAVLPKYVSTLRELGVAMINSVTKGYDKPILEPTDIVELSKK